MRHFVENVLKVNKNCINLRLTDQVIIYVSYKFKKLGLTRKSLPEIVLVNKEEVVRKTCDP